MTPALAILGLTQDEFFPNAVREVYNQLERPADIDWVGTPIWITSYIAALRALATFRRYDRLNNNSTPDSQTFNEQWADTNLNRHADSRFLPGHLGDSALRQVAIQSQSSLHHAAQQVRIANKLLVTPSSELPSAAWSHKDDNRSGLQAHIADSLRWFSVSPPRMSEETKLEYLPRFPNAFLVVLPTASGKTKVAGDWLASQGVGEGEHRPKVLWVTDQQKLVDDCLNPNKTLVRCLPNGTKLTAVWEGHKTEEDVSGDVVVVTKNSLEVELESDLIRPEDYDIVVFDEADVMLSDLKQSVIQRFERSKKLFLTATPSRSTRKDLQRLMHHFRPVTLLEAAEQEIIAPVRILTYTARDPTHAEQLATAIALNLFIKQGKKVVAYCQPGGGNAQALRLAQAVNYHAPDVLGEAYDPDEVYAEMVGKVRENSAEVINHFEASDGGHLLGTCSMAGRGWDPKRLDGCIFIGPQGDYVALRQKAGRTFRIEPDNPDKIALIIQIKYPPNPNQNDYTIEMAFGFEEVISGITLGSGARSGSAGRGEKDPELERLLAELPEELRVALQPLGRPLAEILIAPDDVRREHFIRPEGYTTSLTDLMGRYPGVPREWFKHTLSNFAYDDPTTKESVLGVRYVLIRSLSPEIDNKAERYYETSGVELFLSKVSVPKVATAKSLSALAIANRLSLPYSLVKLAASRLNFNDEGKKLSAEGRAKAGWRYNTDQQLKIVAWIEAIPVADDTKVWYSELTKQYGRFVPSYFAARGIKIQICRHPEDSDLNGLGPYVDVMDADAMKAEHVRIKQLLKTSRSLGDVARRTGITNETIVRELTPDEQAHLDNPALRFVPFGSTKPARHFPSDVADALERRLLNDRLEPHEVSRRAIAEWLGISESRVSQIIPGHYQLNSKRIGPRNASTAVYHIAALVQVQAHYGRSFKRNNPEIIQRLETIRQKLAVIEVGRLPRIGEEMTADQIEYTTVIQREILGIPDNLLDQPFPSPETTIVEQPAIPQPVVVPAKPPADEWISYEAVVAELSAEKHAFLLLIREAGIAETDISRNKEGEITSFSSQAVERMNKHRIGSAPTSWIRLAYIAKNSNTTPEEAFKKLREIEATFPRPFGEQEWRLARNDLSIEIYLHETIGKRAQRELRAYMAERTNRRK